MDFNEISMYLKELNLISIFVRLSLAVIFGGIIGYGREVEKRPAGLRTHILVCIGSTLAMLTNQYVYVQFGGADPTRIGAQVISGIGFLGAGTIIITGKNKVKGLTTAAGLWSCACMGLALGIGFYEGAIGGCLFILAVTAILGKIDSMINNNSKNIIIYTIVNSPSGITILLNRLKGEKDIKIKDLEISNYNINCKELMGLVINLRITDNLSHENIKELFEKQEEIIFYQEIE